MLFKIGKSPRSNEALTSTAKYNIFFIETHFTRDKFDVKQMCAIESAALNNPTASVNVYYMNGLVDEALLALYPNIRPIKISLPQIFEDTILKDWWNENARQVLRGHYAIGHISDMLRLVLLYKHGGFYSDLDTITIKSVEPLLKYNGVGYLRDGSSDSVGNGILVFEAKHPFLLKVIKDIKRNYDPTHWSGIGPRVIIRVLGPYCEVENIFESLKFNPIRLVIDKLELRRSSNKQSLLYYDEPHKCNVNIFPPNYFYTYSFMDSNFLFESNQTLIISKFIDSFSVHFYGKITLDQVNLFKQYSIFEFFAMKNCPYIYEHIMKQYLLSKQD